MPVPKKVIVKKETVKNKEEKQMAIPKKVIAKKVATPTQATPVVAKKVIAKKVMAPAVAPVAKKAAPVMAKKAVAPVAKKAAPKVGSAKPVATKTATTSVKKITVGRKKENASINFKINIGGRTTRDAFIHILFETLQDKGLELPSKKSLSDIIACTEEVLQEVTSKSNFKFAGAMFRLRHNKARVYSVPTTSEDTMVPEHDKVIYSRYADPLTVPVQGSYDPETHVFLPTGESEGIVMEDAEVEAEDAEAETEDAEAEAETEDAEAETEDAEAETEDAEAETEDADEE